MLISTHQDARQREPFLAVVSDEVTYSQVSRIATDFGWSQNQILIGGMSDTISSLSHIETPDLLIVDISDDSTPLEAMKKLADVCEESTRVIVLGTKNDLRLYRQLLDLGVQDYLLKPVSADALKDTIETSSGKIEPAGVDTTTGRLIAVTGSRGGVGASTIALNTAWSLAHDEGMRTALIDLDLYFGAQALSLDLEPGRGFRESLENPNRIDGLFIERAMVRVSEHLYVLAAEERLENAFSFDPEALESLLGKLRADFDFVVVDLPRFAARTQIGSISPPSSVILVSDLSLPGMRDTMRLSELIRQMAPGVDIRIAANRQAPLKQGALDVSDFESGSGLKIDFNIPDDTKGILKAEGEGKAVVDILPRSKTSQMIRHIASDVSGLKNVTQSVSMWSKIMRRS